MIKIITFYLFLIILALLPYSSFAQSPANLNNDIQWNAGFSTIVDIETAYNNARRQEEIQLNLVTDILGFLTLPSDWNSKTDSEKILFLVNEERTIRGGVDYGAGPCLGLPLEGVESNLNDLADAHAQWLGTHNEFSHIGENNWDAFTRIDNNSVLGEITDVGDCHEFMSRSENLAGFWSFSATIPFLAEQAVYGWVYKNEPNWGHRQGILLQDMDLNHLPFGYDNNHGYNVNEGFLGVGIYATSGGAYDPFNFGSWVDGGAVVVFNILDPVEDADCAYAMESALPIELGDFTAQVEGKTVRLNWTTFSEENNAYFSIQHSNKARDFTELKRVEGAQNSTEKKEYSWLHPSPVSGYNYYRLEQFDTNGDSKFSKIILIQLVKDWSGNIQNTLASAGEDLHLKFNTIESTNIKITIYDVNGHQVYAQSNYLSSGKENVFIKLNDLSSGLHFVVISSKNQVESYKVFVADNSK